MATGSWTELEPLFRAVFCAGQCAPRHRGVQHRAAVGAPERGFTLLEVLVVLFIIGIMFSLAVLRVGDQEPEQTVRQEAERLRALLMLAREQAVLEGREFSLSFNEEGYEFLVLEDDRWQPIEDDALFRERRLPEGVTFDLRANELPVELLTTDEEEAGPVPHVLLLSSGELTPFQLTLYAQQGAIAYRLEGQYEGELIVERGEAF